MFCAKLYGSFINLDSMIATTFSAISVNNIIWLARIVMPLKRAIRHKKNN